MTGVFGILGITALCIAYFSANWISYSPQQYIGGIFEGCYHSKNETRCSPLAAYLLTSSFHSFITDNVTVFMDRVESIKADSDFPYQDDGVYNIGDMIYLNIFQNYDFDEITSFNLGLKTSALIGIFLIMLTLIIQFSLGIVYKTAKKLTAIMFLFTFLWMLIITSIITYYIDIDLKNVIGCEFEASPVFAWVGLLLCFITTLLQLLLWYFYDKTIDFY